MKRNDYKKLCKVLNNNVGGWNDYELKVEHTGFFDGTHAVGAQRNNVGSLIELQTRIIEADGIHVESSYKSSYLHVYIHSGVESSHRFGRYKPTLFVIRDPKGNRHELSLIKTRDRDKADTGRLKSIFGYDISNKYPEEYERFIGLEGETDNVKFLKNAKSERDHWLLGREFTEKFYQNLISYMEYRDYEKIKAFMTLMGFKIDTVFQYTHKFSLSPDYVNHNGSTDLEFGWTSQQTYNALPYTLKISKVKEIKTVALSKLGIEGAGYYSHDDRMQIRPEQVRAAKKFFKKFNETKNETIQAVIDSVKKRGGGA